jgi:Holliday junction resolvase RusA-like endonuclease
MAVRAQIRVPRKLHGIRPSDDRPLTVAVPLPPECMWPNARSHWKAKMGPKKKQREDAALSIRGTLFELHRQPPLWSCAECQCTFYMPRKRDSDNCLAAMKASFDALADAGVIANDSGLIHLPVKQITGKAAKGERKVVLVITRRV